MKNITLLGSTGSIGVQALNVMACYPDRFKPVALSAGRQVRLLAEQAWRFKPRRVAVADADCYGELRQMLCGLDVEILAGSESICELAAQADNDMVLNAVVGFAGLAPTLAALGAANNLALANKESLVAGGHLVMSLAREKKCALIPVDSEHSAVFQCLQGQRGGSLEKIVLTASGGPFYGFTDEELRAVTPAGALKHPNWAMGSKITIDSATLMNKGLEVIEAHWLFGVPYEKIEVVIHRESIIHSMVEFTDTAVLAQLGAPDMRTPIQYALTYPERLQNEFPRLNWKRIKALSFDEPDHKLFPSLQLAISAGEAGGSMPAALNAANEEAVRLFLSEKIGFLDIPRIIEAVMNKHKLIQSPDYADLVEVDRSARESALAAAVTKG